MVGCQEQAAAGPTCAATAFSHSRAKVIAAAFFVSRHDITHTFLKIYISISKSICDTSDVSTVWLIYE